MKKIIINFFMAFIFTNYCFSQDAITVSKNSTLKNNDIELQSILIPLSEYKEVKKVKKEAIILNKDYKRSNEIYETSMCIKVEDLSNYSFPKKGIQKLYVSDDFEKNQITLEPVSLIPIKKN